MSDIHGEYEAFSHILNSGSGEVRHKLTETFGDANFHNIDFFHICLCVVYTLCCMVHGTGVGKRFHILFNFS